MLDTSRQGRLIAVQVENELDGCPAIAVNRRTCQADLTTEIFDQIKHHPKPQSSAAAWVFAGDKVLQLYRTVLLQEVSYEFLKILVPQI